MESLEKGSRALISGIEDDARREAEQIILDAKKQAEERKKYLEKQVKSILLEAEEKARVQSEVVSKRILSGLDIEVKRKFMHLKDNILGEILGRVKEEFKTLIKKPEYRTVLQNWIIEAMIGLGAEKAEVIASKSEQRLIDKELLDSAEKRVKELTGHRVKLRVLQNQAHGPQGVVLTAEDGRTAFNNQVTTRLLRKQRIIRNLIYEKIFDE